jgi:hypothetical protein
MTYQETIRKCLDQDMPDVIQCKSCSTACNIGSICNWNNQVSTQKKIWNLVGASSSQYQDNIAALSGLGSLGPCVKYWNQGSDRQSPGQPTAYVSRARTRSRPGGTGTAGAMAAGVDIKHNSYSRYLARKKGPHLATIPRLSNGSTIENLPLPNKGNKRYAIGFVENCYIRK